MQIRTRSVRMLRQAVLAAGVAGMLASQLLTAQSASSPQLIASAEAPPATESTTTTTSSPTASDAQQPGLTVLDELNAMKRRIEKLEEELKAAKGAGAASPTDPAAGAPGSLLAPRAVLPGTVDPSKTVASAAVDAEDQAQPEAPPAAAPAAPAVD